MEGIVDGLCNCTSDRSGNRLPGHHFFPEPPLGSSRAANEDLGDREDWAHLRGGMVEVRLDGNLVRVGKVGQATADSTMLWIEADAVEQRALFVKSAGYTVRPHYGNANR
jgi:hypothetical protein